MPDLLPELDTPPANGVFVDWEDERETEARRRFAPRLLGPLPDVDDIEAEGNAMGESIDVADDFDNGLE